ncbi:MAG: Abortive infection protein [Candidatus Saccharibacteria bacterium GW2011_GWC2_48_9]|nr:MAG: Abortive infection protein [Candidatus Saccharibacteria bacterium GW2011_GWC2_48_9]HCH34354.1 CPBP family intramembrane metalloprotease [Candidatus Saccharibacteria bacterium]
MKSLIKMNRKSSSVVVIGVITWILSLLTLVVLLPEGLKTSADAGAPAVPYWIMLLPLLLGILITAALPKSAESNAPKVDDKKRLSKDVKLLITCAVLFPLIVGVAGASDSLWYLVLKLGILLAVPLLFVSKYKHSVILPKQQNYWRWLAPSIVLLVWLYMSAMAPWIVNNTAGIPDDITVLIIGGLITAVTAGVLEEVFYRRWLQTRLEASIGMWAGIIITALLYAGMHLGDGRQQAGLLVEIASVVLFQGTLGVMLGYLWSKYRNLFMVIAIHILLNGYTIAVHVFSTVL